MNLSSVAEAGRVSVCTWSDGTSSATIMSFRHPVNSVVGATQDAISEASESASSVDEETYKTATW